MDFSLKLEPTARIQDLKEAFTKSSQRFTPRINEYCEKTKSFWVELSTNLLRRSEIEDPGGEFANKLAVEIRANSLYHLYPECHEVIHTLRPKGYKLGIISNATDEILRRLNWFNLARSFDSVTFSQEIGCDKPSKEIFLKAIQRSGASPETCVHVGNSYENDVIGARSVGKTPILIDRNNLFLNADCLR